MRYFKYMGFAVWLFVIACTSAKEAYQKGEYESAIQKSLKNLKAEKDIRQNKTLLNNAFDKRYAELNNRFEDRAKLDLKLLEKLYSDCDKFLVLATEVKPYLESTNIEKKLKLDKNTDLLEDEICTALYEKAIDHYDNARVKKDKKEARLAYETFMDLSSYDSQKKYKETNSLLEKSLELATYHYQFDIDHGFNIGESWEIKSQFSKLSNKGSTFKKFYTEGQCKPCDCVIELNFRDLRESKHTSTETKSFEKKVEDGYTTTKDDKGNVIKTPVYKILRGQVVIEKTRFDFNWEIKSEVKKETVACDADYRTFDASKSIDLYDYRLSGDRDAIPSEYKNYTRPTLDKDDLIDDLLEDLFNQVVNYYD